MRFGTTRLPYSLADRLAEATLSLCRIPSVTGDERASADAVEARLRQTPLPVQRVGNTVLAAPPPDERPLLLLVGQLDTVPGEAGEVRREGDHLYGLGASDMKGGLAVMLALAEDRVPGVGARVGYVCYDREEGPWAESGLGPALEAVPWLRTAALAFCLEPSDNVVQVGCLGTLHLRVSFRGRAAHSARPWQGRNAIHDAGPLLVALAGRPPREVDCGGFAFHEVVSATLAEGGHTRNVVPERCTLNLNFRFAPGRSREDAMESLVGWVAEALGATREGDWLRRSDGLGVELSFAEVAPSGRVVVDNPHLRRFVVLNGNVVAAKQAWTDVARFSEAGVDAVNLGPGLAAQAHQAGEHASVRLLAASYRQFRRFLEG